MTKPTNCFYVNLSDMMPALPGDMPKCFDGMAAGVFTDMWGEDVIIRPEDLAVYVANTKGVLASTVDSSGATIGLPIDTIDHRGGLAAGWIIDVNMTEGANTIQFTPRWNDTGMSSISGDQVHYFSPTFDMVGRTILGGSLTNWPATRDAAHNMLLKPIELGSSILTAQDEPTGLPKRIIDYIVKMFKPVTNLDAPAQDITNLQGVIMEPKAIEVTPPATVNLSDPAVLAAVEKRAQEIAAAKLADEKRKADIATFVTSLSAGNGKTGVAIDAEGMTTFLSSLPDPAPAMEQIRKVASATIVDFSEHGTSRVLEGTQPLPENLKPILLSWINAGLTLEAFFKDNAVELGSMADYNLSEYKKEK